MEMLSTPTRTPIAGPWMARQDTQLGEIQRALLSTVDGHRNIIELESVARAMGLEPSALERFRHQGLIEFSTNLQRGGEHHA